MAYSVTPDDRVHVLHRLHREAIRMARRLRPTEPLAVCATTIARLAEAESLEAALEHVAWMSLIVVGDEPLAAVEVEIREYRVSTAFGQIPKAIAAAMASAERAVTEPFTIDDVVLVKIGQIGVMALWVRPAGLLVPLQLRSNRREIQPNRPHTEQSFIAAVAGVAARIARSDQ